MGNSLENLLLRLASASPRVRLETVHRRDFTDAVIRELHALANALMAEDLQHFRVHAQATDLVHVFRRADTSEIVGFQFWRTGSIDLPGSRTIVGGKVRIRPEFRGRGLHLLSGLAYYLGEKLRAPRTRFYRLSLASLFGFVSITEALADYRFFELDAQGAEARAVRDALIAQAKESHFWIDPATGLFFVDIRPTEETLGRYSARYFEKEAARAYARVNPEWRTNGCYVGFWFEFTPNNLLALTSAIRRRLQARPPTARPSR